MKKKLLILSLAVVMLALPMSAVLAKNDKFIYVSGEFPITYAGDLTIEQKGKSDTRILTYEFEAYWSGGITGAGTTEGFWVMIKYDPITYDLKQLIPQDLTVLSDPTIDGEEYEGDLIIGGSPTSWRIIGGTGELANVHGQGTKWSIDPFTIGYEGWIHFDA